MPRVSVVIPVRDQAAYLAESLASVFAQPYRDIEVIVVDDGSAEDLHPALAPHASRIRFERQPASGVAAATNRGAALAQGELLAFHDADDLMEPTRITSLLTILDAQPTYALAFGNGTRVSAVGVPLGPVIPPRQARRLARHGLRPTELLRRSLIYLQASLVRRSAFEALGGLPPFSAGADWGFTLRCAFRYPIGFVDASLFRYRQHAGSLTAARVAMATAAVAVLRDLAASDAALVARIGRRRFEHALARRLARLAAQELRVGDTAAARTHLAEASALAPLTLKYRWRSLRLAHRPG